jgi:uncharacterized membrane protein YbhN (UPF0104 family)
LRIAYHPRIAFKRIRLSFKRMQHPVRIALLLGKIAVTVALLWFALRTVDFSLLADGFTQARAGLLLAGVLVLALQPLIGAVRWFVIMRQLGAEISLAQSVRLTYVSTLLNQVLPGGVGGDAIRMWFSFREGHQLSHALNGVALDRILGFVALLAAASLCALSLDGSPRLRMLAASLAPIAVGALIALAVMMILDRIPASLARFRSVRALGYLAKDARKLLFSPGCAPQVLALSLLGIANLCVSLFLFLLAFNASLDALLLAAAVPPLILASSLPITVGGWGTREAATVAMMSALSAAPEPGLLASITFGFAGIFISLPGVLSLYRSMSRKVAGGAAAPRGAPTVEGNS